MALRVAFVSGLLTSEFLASLVVVIFGRSGRQRFCTGTHDRLSGPAGQSAGGELVLSLGAWPGRLEGCSGPSASIRVLDV